MNIYACIRIDDVLEGVSEIHARGEILLLSTFHRHLEKRARSSVTLAQLNELFNSHASSLIELWSQQLAGYIIVHPVVTDGRRDAYLYWNGQTRIAGLRLRIKTGYYLGKWSTFLTLCCPLYESHLWDHAELFTNLHSDLATLNGDLGTNASFALESLCEAFPEIRLVEDRNHGERLVFYPSYVPPKHSKDYLYYLFFQFVESHKEIRFSELCRKMRRGYRVDLNGETLRRIFRSNAINPLNIIRRSMDFPKDKFKVTALSIEDDFVLSVLPQSHEGRGGIEEVLEGASSSSGISQRIEVTVKKNVVDHVIDFLKENGGISLMADDVQLLVNKKNGKNVRRTYEEAVSSAQLLTSMSSGRLEICDNNGLCFIRLAEGIEDQ